MKRIIDVDVAIIGAGIFGLATAYELRKRGVAVALFDKGLIGAEASARNGGGVRAEGRLLPEIPLAQMAIEMWKTLDATLGRPTGYKQTGHIYIAENDADWEKLEKMKASEATVGLVTEMIGPEKLYELTPGLKPGYPGAKYCPTDGVAEPAVACVAYAEAAEELGAILLPGEAVRQIGVMGGKIAWVESDNVRVNAPIVINSAGPWAPIVAQLVDVYLPIYPARTNMSYTEPVEFLASPFVQSASQNMAIRQLPGGNILLAQGAPQPKGMSQFTFSKDFFGTPLSDTPRPAKAGEMFPALAAAKIVGRWAGIRENTPDNMPIIDKSGESVGGPEGLFTAAGFSGHGFCLGPSVGRLLTEWIVDGKPSMDLSAFTHERFMRANSPWAEVRLLTQQTG